MRVVALVLFLIVFGCFGCEQPMTNDEIISEHIKCRNANLCGVNMSWGIMTVTKMVECRPCN